MNLGLLLLIAGFAIFCYVASRMYRSEMYGGARIEQVLGEFTDEGIICNVTLRVHRLRREDREEFIGIQLVRKVLGLPQMWEYRALAVSQAQQLGSLLQSAMHTPASGKQEKIVGEIACERQTRTFGVITRREERLTIYLSSSGENEKLISIDLNVDFGDGETMPSMKLSISQAQQLASLLDSETRTLEAT